MRRILSRAAAATTVTAATLSVVNARYCSFSTTVGLYQSATLPDKSSLQQHVRRASRETKELQAVTSYTHAFSVMEGRRPRILLCTFEDCSQGRPDDAFAILMADLGFDVDIGPAKQSPEQIARQAVEADVHGVYVSVLSAHGAAPLRRLVECLKQEGADDVFVIVAAAVAPENIPNGVRYVKRGEFIAAAETIQSLLQASDKTPQ